MSLLTDAYDLGLLDTGDLSDMILYEISSQVNVFCEDLRKSRLAVDLLNQAILDCDDPQISRAFDLTSMSGSREFFLYLSEEQVSLDEFLKHVPHEESPFTHVCMVNKNKFVFFTLKNIKPFFDVARDYLVSGITEQFLDQALDGIGRG
ncbi:hypothetical protein [Veillonella sp. VA139]|uniref:hypothetical protein n=1 Tax=Veillonella sp. VA139 TaxID=741830 RepID=UPI000F8D2FC8|nr:hypothetical protein [Veillonella sp. VA139]